MLFKTDANLFFSKNLKTDSAGFINKEDFMRFAKDKKLTDFDEWKDDTPKKEWAPAQTSTPVNLV